MKKLLASILMLSLSMAVVAFPSRNQDPQDSKRGEAPIFFACADQQRCARDDQGRTYG